MLFIVQMGIVRNEHIVLNHLFYDGMTAFFDIDDTFFVQRRPHIMIPFRNIGKCGADIQFGNRSRRFLNPFNLSGNRFPDFTENIVFQRIQLVFCVQNRVFQFFQARCRVTFCIGKRLFPDIIIRDHIFIGICHFKIVAEYFVIFDAQVFNAGALFVLVFQRGEPVFPFRFGLAQFVD